MHSRNFMIFPTALLFHLDRLHTENLSSPLFYLLIYRSVEELIIPVSRVKAHSQIARIREGAGLHLWLTGAKPCGSDAAAAQHRAEEGPRLRPQYPQPSAASEGVLALALLVFLFLWRSYSRMERRWRSFWSEMQRPHRADVLESHVGRMQCSHPTPGCVPQSPTLWRALPRKTGGRPG